MRTEGEANFREELEAYLQSHWTGPQEGPVPVGEVRKETSKEGLSSLDALSLEKLISEMGETFHERLFSLIDRQGMKEVEVYRRANLDRRFFSKIRSNPAYHPRKNVVISLAVALRLDMDEAEDLLARAGYALAPGNMSDVIVGYFIDHRIFDLDTINLALHEHDLPAL